MNGTGTRLECKVAEQEEVIGVCIVTVPEAEEAAVGLLEEQEGSAAAVLDEDACDDVWSHGYRDRNGL